MCLLSQLAVQSETGPGIKSWICSSALVSLFYGYRFSGHIQAHHTFCSHLSCKIYLYKLYNYFFSHFFPPWSWAMKYMKVQNQLMELKGPKIQFVRLHYLPQTWKQILFQIKKKYIMWISVCCNCILSVRCFGKWLQHHFKPTASDVEVLYPFEDWVWLLQRPSSLSEHSCTCLNCCWWHSMFFPPLQSVFVCVCSRAYAQ